MWSVTNAGDASNARPCGAPYGELQAQGVSPRQAAQLLAVPRSPLQAWRTYQASLDACPAGVAFFHRGPGLAFLQCLVLALPVVLVEIGACGMRLVCLVLALPGLNRFVGASCGTQQPVNRHVEEAMVTSRHDETARLAEQRPPQDSTVTQDETCTGGLCLVDMELVRNYIGLEHTAQAHDHAPWRELMAAALAPLKGNVMQSTSEEAPGRLA